MVDFNPETPAQKGFTFEDLKSEIEAGYPVLIFLQDYTVRNRALSGMAKANPEIHGMLAYGYLDDPSFGVQYVFCKTSWGIGEQYYQWSAAPWVSNGRPGENLSVRGVIGFHPSPRIRSIRRNGGSLTLDWEGPASSVTDRATGLTEVVHRFVIEQTSGLDGRAWTRVGEPTTKRTVAVPAPAGASEFFRVRLLALGEQ